METPPKLLPKRLIGIDFGLKRIGISLSDERHIFASPYKILLAEARTESTIEKLLAMISEIASTHKCEIEEIVIGIPLMMSGKKGVLADAVQHFVDAFKKHSSIPIVIWDERLTTVQAERTLRETSMNRKKRSKVIDLVSASIILQAYLDSKAWKKNISENVNHLNF